MCGIAGVFVAPGHQVDRAGLERMTQRLAHRGPDGAGVWLAADGRIGLGHRRLSIIDVSSAGAQPMTSAGGRYRISFNGEIYNFTDLRQLLERDGAAFRGHSDTEVALAAFERWGVEQSIARFNGMFAIAVWDSRERRFYLVRDRLGIKPLYFRQTWQELVFASELRALHAYTGASLPLSPEGMASYFRFGYIPGATAIFSGVRKLEPGTMLLGQGPDVLAEKKYWSVEGAALAGLRDPYVGTEEECTQELERQLRSAVRRQMVSDVPLGAFLSGGIDSSTVTALMQAESPRPVRSFSIGFEDQAYNEAPHAARIAAHLGTDHTELYVTDREAREVIPRLAEIYDEPLADISQIPTSLLAQLTRKHVTVSLSGDGGDELFAGYDRYLLVPRVWKRLRILPHSLLSVIAAVLRRVAPGSWDAVINGLGQVLPPRWVPA